MPSADPADLAGPAEPLGRSHADRSGRWRTRVDAALAAVTAALLVLGVGGVLGGMFAPDRDAVAVPRPATAVDPEPDVVEPPNVVASAPARLRVPSLGVRADVVPIRLSADAVLEPPGDGRVVGWWDGSAEPGATRGRVVMTGHTLSRGDGALDRMREVRTGARVLVRTPTGTRRYDVTDRFVVDYATVAERARDIFTQEVDSPDGAPLVLITCTDFDGRIYHSNVIVVAAPA